MRLNKKWIPYLLIGLLAVILVVARVVKKDHGPRHYPSTPRTTVNRDHGFDRRVSYLEYSEHALCRMQCRHISKEEVEDIMQTGHINYRKSELKNNRCPRYAVEGITKDDQRVRIVFAQCNEKTEVVTTIDLDNEWECHCPGDDK